MPDPAPLMVAAFVSTIGTQLNWGADRRQSEFPAHPAIVRRTRQARRALRPRDPGYQ